MSAEPHESDEPAEASHPPNSQAQGTEWISQLPVEILQLVLSYLDFRQLYRCQQVSKFWRACISNPSPAIKEALWLVSTEEPLHVAQLFRGAHAPRLIVEMEAVRKISRTHERELPRITFECRISCLLYKNGDRFELEPHPMLPKLENPNGFQILRPRRYHGVVRSLFFEPSEESNRKVEPPNVEGSWREMFMCLPPVDNVCFNMFVSNFDIKDGHGIDHSIIDEDVWVQQEGGVRMKHVVERLQDRVKLAGEFISQNAGLHGGQRI